MIYYVAHEYGGLPENVADAKQITRMLALANPDNVYISPLLAFSHIKYKEISYEVEMQHCIDLLSRCDGLIVTGKNISEGVKREIDAATDKGIPITFL